MKEQQQTTEPVEHKKGNPPKFKNALDRISRRQKRASFRKKYNNNRIPKNTGFLQMGAPWDDRAIFQPKRKKLKGYQKKG